MLRHKVITTLLALVLIGTVGSALDNNPGPPGVASPSADGATGADANDSAEATRDGTDQSGDEPSPKPKRSKSPASEQTFTVTRIVDGDTIELGNGETVRLVGIDTPESGACGSLKATQNLSALIAGQRVRLTTSDEDRDRYGRLLRYVNLGSLDAGLRQIRDGYAIARYDSRDGYGHHAREDLYIRADKSSPNFTCTKPPQLAGLDDSCAAGYSPCIAPYPPDLDCPDVDGPIYVTGDDPHGLDGDGDGIACE